MDKQKYEKGGSAGSKGSQFQVHLLTIFLLNSLRMKLTNWKLSTEDKRAGKFDDVVLEWSNGAILLQAKHKESKKRIIVEQLMSTTSKNDDFSIPKYFLSYQEIKDKFPSFRKAVICTNASVNERALTFLNRQTNSADSILFCGGDKSIYYTLDDEILPELKDTIKTYYSQNCRGREDDELVISNEDLKDFQKHFQIYFEYPSGKALENIVEQLLGRVSWRVKASALEIYSKVMDWFQQKDGNFLTDLLAQTMISEIGKDKYWQSLKQYDVYFKSNDLNFEDSKRRYHFIAEGVHLLQEIRIWQALRSIEKNVLYIHPEDSVEDQKQVIEAFRLSNYIYLIIVQPNEYVVIELWDQIEEILNEFAYKNVVLLTARDNKLVQLIQSDNNGFDVTKESPTFEELSKETRDRLMKVKNILFQGKIISLEDLFAPSSMQDYRTFLESETLERLVRGEEIRVGPEVLVLGQEVERCYIPRHFIRENENRHDENIFDANDRLILIADSAGMGKSTTLTKLAMFIKESSPHLWVVKIVLDHYSKFLKDLLRKHKRTIDIMEFLDSHGATRLTNQLDKLVFSLNDKVVLMLDGIDEISPTYTELVESLLDNCLRAPNIIKIFATTRPHLAEKLEEKFQVKSFVLEPFSERNQIDFLSNHWIQNLGHTDRDKCEQYARALVQKMFSWTNSNFRRYDDFAAIPLQVKMVAEIFQESGRNEGMENWEGCKEFLNADRLVPALPERIDLARLYKLFIEKKRDVFIDKYNPSGSAGAEQALDDQFEESLVFHRTLALDVIVDDEMICDRFSCYKEGGRMCKANALKIGIMQEIDNSLDFIHRTFAEYFVAECLITELQSHNQNAEFQKFLLDEILLNTQFSVICSFFDGLLQECVDSLPHDTFQNYQCLSYDIGPSNSNYFNLVHDLAEKGYITTLQLLLKCVDFKTIRNKETSVSELHQQVPSTHNALVKRYFGNRLKILQLFVQRGGINIKDTIGRTPLHLAARGGHLEMVKFLVEQGANINIRYNEQRTPLYEATSRGHSAIVEFLVDQGADIIANVRQSGCELYEAVCRNHVRIVNYLLDKILECGRLERGLYAEYAMIPFAAAYLGRIDILEFLVTRGMDVNRRITNRQSLLFGAVMGGQLEAAKYLVRQGADINSRDIENNTVLHLISKNSSLTRTGMFLVDLGIETDIKNKFGKTALHVAVGEGARDMAEFLIKSGADVNSTDKLIGHSILQTAAFKNHLSTVELLADHGADINYRNTLGDTLLHSLTISGQLDVVKCLVKLGVDVTARDRDGRTALHVAVLLRRVDIAKYLIECSNIDVNSRDNDGQTILHTCVSLKAFFGRTGGHMPFHNFAPERLDIVKRLVTRGANINITNNEGQTVLHLAIVNVALKCSITSCDQCLLVIKFFVGQGGAIATGSSKGDVKEMLAKEIQKDVRYHGQSLKTILRSPVFGLLDTMLASDHEDVASSTHLK